MPIPDPVWASNASIAFLFFCVALYSFFCISLFSFIIKKRSKENLLKREKEVKNDNI